MALATQTGKEFALAALQQRRANSLEQVDYASLPIDSPIYFYCISCGYISDELPENWLFATPKKLCDECQALKELGWLE